MKNKLSFIVIMFLFVLTVSCHKMNNFISSKQINTSTALTNLPNYANNEVAKPNSCQDNQEADKLLATYSEVSNSYKSTLNEISDYIKTCPNQNERITDFLTGEVKNACSKDTVIFSQTDFEKLKLTADFLAETKSNKPLKTLIGCLNVRNIISGHYVSSYPTMASVIQYRDNALPELERGLNYNQDSELKCQIVVVLAQIGGKKAKRILLNASKNEFDKQVKICIEAAMTSPKIEPF